MRILSVYPEIEAGLFPVKTEIDRPFSVTAAVSADGKTRVLLKWQKLYPDATVICQQPMVKTGEEEYQGVISFEGAGIYEYWVEASEKSKKSSWGKIPLWVEPVYARFGSWYEMFHRSQGKIPGKSAVFKDMEERLSDIKNMGFDVIYLPPVHPVGKTKRKGPNNSLEAGPGDPGSPWAIGNDQGGHKAVNPELGTLGEFRHFVEKANGLGIEVAIDYALNCSPDHPYVKEHPGWFHYRPDGTIICAENPPKKYEDVYPLNFYPEDREAMWEELKSIILFWREQGIKIFRGDNPHTKPSELWQWMILETKKTNPEIIFFAEAFTYYEKLEALGKIGFSQSYTYFTWRNKRDEIMEYFERLTQGDNAQFLRGNLFTNTPDICPPIIQEAGRPAFKMRAALAATLSSSYGIYNGYELCESKAFAGTEVYADSEKYQYKVWDWDRPGNIKEYFSRINLIRKENEALRLYDNLVFIPCTDEGMISYLKLSSDKKNILIVVINLNPWNTKSTRITVPVEKFYFPSQAKYTVRELITDKVYPWTGRDNYVLLDPQQESASIFRVERIGHPKEKKDTDAHLMAQQHGRHFFELRDKTNRNNDVSARRELKAFYEKEIAHRIYTGPFYNDPYKRELDRISVSHGFISLV